MDREGSAARLGIAAAVATLALAGVPYLLADPSAVRAYHDAGPAGPPLVALFAVVVAIALAAGVRRRTDPALAAGIALAIGGFATLIAWWWALAVSPSLVGGFTTVAAFGYHRWLLAAATTLLPASGGFYARSVL